MIKAARLLVLALFLTSILGIIFSDFIFYNRLLYVSLVIGVGSWFWTRFSLRHLDVRREARSLRAGVGDIFEERFELINESWLPRLWVEMVNETSMPQVSGSRLVTGVRGRQKVFYTSRTWLTRRGAFKLGPTRLASGDPFGLFRTEIVIEAEDTLVVLPYIAALESFPLAPGLITGGRVIRQKALDVTPHAAGVREYVPGDPMKRIHWPTTARRDQLMVKEFDDDPQTQVWLFLDAQLEAQAALPEKEIESRPEDWLFAKRPTIKLPASTFEYAVSITASLAHYFIMRKQAVGFATVGQLQTIIPAERSQRQEDKILESLAFIEAEGNLPIFGLVRSQATLLPRGSSTIIVTPSVRTELLTTVEDLQRRSLHPVVVLVMAKSFGGFIGSEDLANALTERGIPVCRVYNEADIKITLNEFGRENSKQENGWQTRPYIHWT